MKGCRVVISSLREVGIEEFEIDEKSIGPKDILLKTIYTMISPGTELSTYTALAPELQDPKVWPSYPGYLTLGKVIAKGSDITRVDINDIVYCFSNHASIARISEGRVSGRDFYLKMPPDISKESILLTRFATIGLTSLRVSSANSGDIAVVIGLGLVGNFAAQLFEIAGIKVIGVDLSNKRLELAHKAGITYVINPSNCDLKERVLDLTKGKGVDLAIDAVGDSRVVLQGAALVKKMGEVIILGTPRASYKTDVTQLLKVVHLNWITLKGALEWCFPLYKSFGSKYSLEENTLYVWQLLQEKKLYTEGFITHVIHPKDFKEAYEGLLNKKDKYLGVLVDWRAVTS